MNISPLAATGPGPINISALAGVASTTLIGALESADLAVFGNDANVVDISSLGQLMSTIASFQASQATTAGAATNGFGGVAATAELLVGAVNDFAASNNNSAQDLLATAAGNPFQTVFDVPSSSNSGVTLLAALSQIGVTDQTNTAVPAGPSQFAVNLTTLQTAFGTDPAGTATVLAQAFTILGKFAATVVGQSANLFPSDTTSALDNVVPVSPSASAAVDTALASLSPVDAARVSTALQSLLNDQALGAAAVESLPTTAPATLLAPVQSNDNPVVSLAAAAIANSPALPATNVVSASQAQVNPSGDTANTAPVSSAVNANTPSVAFNLSNASATAVPATVASIKNAPAGTAASIPVATSTAPGNTVAAVAQPQTASTQVGQAQSNALAATAAFVENNAPPILPVAATWVASPGAAAGSVSGTTAATVAVAVAESVIAAEAADVAAADITSAPPAVAASIVPASPPTASPDTVAASAAAAAVAPSAVQPDSPLAPSLAAAVAAYRVSDSQVGSRVIDTQEPAGELVADVVEVVPVNPVDFAGSEGAAPGRRARNARGSSPATAPGSASDVGDGVASPPAGVDISV